MLDLNCSVATTVELDVSDLIRLMDVEIILGLISEIQDPSSVSNTVVPWLRNEGLSTIYVGFKTKTTDAETIRILVYNIKRKINDKAKEMGIQI